MIEDELKKIWQSSTNEERIKFDKSRLILDVQSSLDHFRRAAWLRDIGEIIVAVGAIPFLLYGAVNLSGMVTKIALIWMTLGCVYIAYRFISSKKNRPNQLASSYLDFIHASKYYLNLRKKMWDTSFYWYILPCFSGMLLFVISYYIQGKFEGRENLLIIFLIGIPATGFYTHVYNMNLMKKSLLPKLKEVNQLLDSLRGIETEKGNV